MAMRCFCIRVGQQPIVRAWTSQRKCIAGRSAYLAAAHLNALQHEQASFIFSPWCATQVQMNAMRITAVHARTFSPTSVSYLRVQRGQ
jgi:hypothetical protein